MKSKYIYLNPENLLDFNIFLLNVYKTDFTKTFYSLIIFINKKKRQVFQSDFYLYNNIYKNNICPQ